MNGKVTRLKSKAADYTAQSKADVQVGIKNLGDLNREFERERAAMNDQIAAITKEFAPKLEALTERIETLQGGIQRWCEANREELCGKGKTANLITGEVQWRQRPPSVRITGVDAVMETLKRLSLARFIRTKDEPNKEAMLNEPAAVQGVAGISIVIGVEDFVITPFEVQAEQERA
jgi:phage host-nuclease inhibitor protein Gam